MKIWRILTIALAGFVLLIAGTAVQANGTKTLYVNPFVANASDSNPGTASAPLRTIAHAVELARINKTTNTSTTILLAPGTYHESVRVWGTINNAFVTIKAQQPGTVIWSGSQTWTGWKKQGNDWVREWPYDWGLQENPWEEWGEWAHMEDIVRRREMVMVNGLNLSQKLAYNQLTTNSFYVDEAANKIYVRVPSNVNLSTASVQVAVQPYLLHVYNMSNFTVEGIRFQHAASSPGIAALQFWMSDNVVINQSQFNWNNWNGLQSYDVMGFTIKNSTFNNNGNGGFLIHTTDNLVMENVEASYNNWRGVAGGWVSRWGDGSKVNQIHNGRFTNFRAVGNHAIGLWIDYDNQNIIVENSYFADNIGAGIFSEANQGPITIRKSTIINTKRIDYAYGGVKITATNKLTLEDNYIAGNETAQIRAYVTDRTVTDRVSGAKTKPNLSGIKISKNYVMGNETSKLLMEHPTAQGTGFGNVQMANNTWCQLFRNDAYINNVTWKTLNFQTLVTTFSDSGSKFNPVNVCSNEVAVAPTATNTPVPPTATNTPVPPTATNTPVPADDVSKDSPSDDLGIITPEPQPEPIVIDNPSACQRNPLTDLKHSQTFIFRPAQQPTVSAQVVNVSTNCTYSVGLASYKMFSWNTNTQEYISSMTDIIEPGETLTFSVPVADCATQVDLFYGELLTSFAYNVRYNERLLDVVLPNWESFCAVPEGVILHDNGERTYVTESSQVVASNTVAQQPTPTVEEPVVKEPQAVVPPTVLSLTELCQRGQFRVDNPNGHNVSFVWAVVGTQTTGNGVVAAHAETYINVGVAGASIDITVDGVLANLQRAVENCPPIAIDDASDTTAGVPVTIPVLMNDSDADGHLLTISITYAPAAGVAVVNADGTITYTPNADFAGIDVFQYSVSDGMGGQASAAISVTVSAPAQPETPTEEPTLEASTETPTPEAPPVEQPPAEQPPADGSNGS